jgi:hypothetical protein
MIMGGYRSSPAPKKGAQKAPKAPTTPKKDARITIAFCIWLQRNFDRLVYEQSSDRTEEETQNG